MITHEYGNITPGKQKYDFYGLSTDEKPTETYEGASIINGSTFMEMDTKTLYFYDEAGKRWV